MNKKNEYNASDVKAVKAQLKDNELKKLQLDEDFRELLSHPYGIRIMQWLMEIGGVFKTSFTGNSQTFFLEGHRNMALMIFHKIVVACPEKISDIVVANDN